MTKVENKAFAPSGNVIILHKRNIEKALEQPTLVRDQLIQDLAAFMGLRTREITTLRWENVNLGDGYLYVLDSKKHNLHPLPIDWRVAELLAKHMKEAEDPTQGWVLRPSPGPIKRSAIGKPLSNTRIQYLVKYYAREAGIPNWQQYNPRLFRCFFAKIWVTEKRDVKILQTLMRHSDLTMTMRYVSRIVFWEDVEREFDRVQTGPFERRLKKLNLDSPVVRQCLNCPARHVCKYIDQAVESEWATGCRFYVQITGLQAPSQKVSV